MSRVGPVIQDLGHNLGLGALITALAGGGELRARQELNAQFGG